MINHDYAMGSQLLSCLTFRTAIGLFKWLNSLFDQMGDVSDELTLEILACFSCSFREADDNARVVLGCTDHLCWA